MQLKLLEQAGLLAREIRIKGRFAVTWVGLTPAGREAFARHMEYLLSALDLAMKQED